MLRITQDLNSNGAKEQVEKFHHATHKRCNSRYEAEKFIADWINTIKRRLSNNEDIIAGMNALNLVVPAREAGLLETE